MAAKKMDLGPTGETVAANVKRIRAGMTYKALAEKMTEIGRPIAELGLRRIENQERRVDADDLVALATALEVSATTLLMPHTNGPLIEVKMTGRRPEAAKTAWEWLQVMPSFRFPEDAHDEQIEKKKWWVVNSTPWWKNPGQHFDADVTTWRDFQEQVDADEAVRLSNREGTVPHGDD